MTWLWPSFVLVILVVLIILGCIGFDTSKFMYVGVGLTTLLFGLQMYFEYKINGAIHYSPKGLSVIIKDKVDAYLLSFGLMCVGVFALCKGLFAYNKK